MDDMLQGSPEARVLSLLVCELLAGYREVGRVLDGYEPPEDERAQVLEPLESAARRAADALRLAPTLVSVPYQRGAS